MRCINTSHFVFILEGGLIVKYLDYERLGIHSRLNHIIKLSGGYNYKLAGELIMK